jgi:hypothetical protein
MDPALLGDAFRDVRVDAVAQAGDDAAPALHCLAPTHVGATASASPTLYWHLSEASTRPVGITLTDERSPQPLLEMRLDAPTAAGIHALDLAEHGVRLEPNVLYTWRVALIANEAAGEKDLAASARLWLAPPDPSTARQLASAPATDRAHRQARLGYWYDAFATVEAWRARQPSTQRLREYEAALLEQADLPDVATALR